MVLIYNISCSNFVLVYESRNRETDRTASLAKLVANQALLSGDPGLHQTFITTGHEMFATAMRSLQLIYMRRLSVTCERMCRVSTR